jgi:ABC-type antimicrobial peptide transport system permease subunit
MDTEKTLKLEVVGIARDAEFQYFGGGKTRPFLYIPHAQHIAGNSLMVLQLRIGRDPLAMAPTVVKAIHDLAPGLPVFQVQTMRQGLYTLNGLLLFQIGASIAAIMGGLGLTLAVIGLYGVVSYAVSRRVHEIGLRMALGASQGDVLRMVLKQGLALAGAGVVLGLAGAAAATRLLTSFLFAVKPGDPLTYLGVAVVLAMVAIAASYLPARRATRIDPLAALRQE